MAENIPIGDFLFGIMEKIKNAHKGSAGLGEIYAQKMLIPYMEHITDSLPNCKAAPKSIVDRLADNFASKVSHHKIGNMLQPLQEAYQQKIAEEISRLGNKMPGLDRLREMIQTVVDENPEAKRKLNTCLQECIQDANTHIDEVLRKGAQDVAETEGFLKKAFNFKTAEGELRWGKIGAVTAAVLAAVGIAYFATRQKEEPEPKKGSWEDRTQPKEAPQGLQL